VADDDTMMGLQDVCDASIPIWMCHFHLDEVQVHDLYTRILTTTYLHSACFRSHLRQPPSCRHGVLANVAAQLPVFAWQRECSKRS